jgi:hypothetical protein
MSGIKSTSSLSSSSPPARGGDDDKSSPDFAPAVALLCQWDCVQQVVSMLTESLDAHLAQTPLVGASENGTEEDDDDNEDADGRSKRKRAEKKKGNQAAAGSTAATPLPMPLALALRLLNFMLVGSDPLAAEARRLILEDENSLARLVGALAQVKQSSLAAMAPLCVEAESGPPQAAMTSGVPPEGKAALVEAVSVYGRLLLHEFGSATEEEGGTGAQQEQHATQALERMAELLDWCAESVLPLALASSSSAVSLENSCESDDDDDCSGGSGDGGVFSPPAKSSRPAGTTPAKLKPAKKRATSEDSESEEEAPEPSSAPAVAVASSSALGSKRAAAASERAELAAAVVSAVLRLAGDWALCGEILPQLCAFAESTSKALLQATRVGEEEAVEGQENMEAAGEISLPSGPSSASSSWWSSSVDTVVGPLCLLTYRLAVQESVNSRSDKSASCVPQAALAFVLRGGRLFDSRESNKALSPSSTPLSSLIERRGFTPGRCLHHLLVLAHNRGPRNHALFMAHVAGFLLKQQQQQQQQQTSVESSGDDAGQVAIATTHEMSESAVLSTVLAHKPSAKLFILELTAKAKDVPAPPPPHASPSSKPQTITDGQNASDGGDDVNDENTTATAAAVGGSPPQSRRSKKGTKKKQTSSAKQQQVLSSLSPAELGWLGAPAVVLLRASLIQTSRTAALAAAAGGVGGGFGNLHRNGSLELAEWAKTEALATFSSPGGAKAPSSSPSPFGATDTNVAAASPRTMASVDSRRALLSLGMPVDAGAP